MLIVMKSEPPTSAVAIILPSGVFVQLMENATI